MFDPKTHEHRTVNWEADPKRETITSRCVPCGEILQSFTFAEAVALNPKLQAAVDEIRQGGSGG